LSLWLLLINVMAAPLCHAPAKALIDGQVIVLCHADDQPPSPASDDGPAGDHCPLCFVCQQLSTGMLSQAPTLVVSASLGIGDAMPLGRDVVPFHFSVGPQQPRAPPAFV